MGVEDLDVDDLLTDYPEGDNQGGDDGGASEANASDDDKGTEDGGNKDDKGNGEAPTVKEEEKLDVKPEIDELDKKLGELRDDEVFKLADDWEPESYKKLLEINEKRNELNKQIAEIESKKQELQNTSKIAEENANRVAEYNKEIDYLVQSGRMPKVVDKTNDDDPGIKRMNELRSFIVDHNKKVMDEGRGYPITSIELALDLLEMKEKLEGKNDEEKKKREEELRKKRGAMIGKGTGVKGSESQSIGYIAGEGIDGALASILQELE